MYKISTNKNSITKKKEKNIDGKCILLNISNSNIIKLIFKLQNIAHFLKIIRENKTLQKVNGLSLITYQIFHYYKKNRINMFDLKKLLKFSQNIKSKLKEFGTLDEIYYGLGLCMVDNFYANSNLRKKNANIIDINMLYEDLYLIYSSLLQNFLSFKINLFFSDKFFIDKRYFEKYYQNFIFKNKNFINGISLEIYDKKIAKSINDSKSIINNNLFGSSFNINRIKFSKIKFSKDEMNLMQLFSAPNINEIYFVSCKLTLFSIEVLSRYINQGENNLSKLIFNDCHIYNNIIEKLIYWNEKDIEYSLIKSILSKLEKLDLSSNKIKDSGFYKLLLYFNTNNKLYGQKLNYLDLSNNKLSSESIKYLLNIENENLNNNMINTMIKELGQSEKLNGLIYLDLSHNPLGNIAKLIFSWKNISLTHLILNDCKIRNIVYDNYNSSNININEEEDEECDLDINSKKENEKKNKFEIEYYDDDNINLSLINLLYLSICQNDLNPKFLKFLFYEIPNLYTIFISSCSLENNSFDEIIKNKKEVNFKKLIMCHNYIDTETIINLYENNIISNVKELNLFDNNLKDKLVDYLINKKDKIQLKKINIDLNFGIDDKNKSLLYEKFIKYTK